MAATTAAYSLVVPLHMHACMQPLAVAHMLSGCILLQS